MLWRKLEGSWRLQRHARSEDRGELAGSCFVGCSGGLGSSGRDWSCLPPVWFGVESLVVVTVEVDSKGRAVGGLRGRRCSSHRSKVGSGWLVAGACSRSPGRDSACGKLVGKSAGCLSVSLLPGSLERR